MKVKQINTKETTKIERLFILDEETAFLAENLDEKSNAIDNEKDLKHFLGVDFQVRDVIVLVELDWGNPLSQWHGYEAANMLMNSSKRQVFFNLLFVSTLERETLHRLNTTKNRVFTQKFAHTQLAPKSSLKNIDVPHLSQRKFNYLKNYCLLETGITDRLEHDARNLLNTIELAKLSKLAEDIKANRDILGNDITNKAEKLLNASTNDKKKMLSEIHQALQQLSAQQNNPVDANRRKSQSRVMLIEDEPQTMQKLESQLQQYFHSVTTFSSGSEAAEELKVNAQQYDVVITDMELLKGNFDDDVQGIDILELCDTVCPHLVTRVVTALPKNALKQLIGKGVDEIVFKNTAGDSVIPPFENLVEFVNKIDSEVKKRKKMRSMPGPKLSWWGKYLTRQLYLTDIQKPEEFSTIWHNAEAKANVFINGGLNRLPENEKLSVTFKALDDASNNPEKGWEIIDLLLMHRLVALWYTVVKSKNKQFYWDDYCRQNGFRSGLDKRAAKVYFTTILGLSGEGLPSSQDEQQKCLITLKDLFPNEWDWLAELGSDLDNVRLKGNFPYLLRFIQDIAVIYKPAATFGSNAVTTNSATDYLKKLINQRINPVQRGELKTLFESDYDLLESLPQEIKNLIDQIKETVQPQV